MDKPYAPRPKVAMASLETPAPQLLPPVSETASQGVDSNNVPYEIAGSLYSLPSAPPPLPFAKKLMDRSALLADESQYYRDQARAFASGGKHDRPFLRKLLPALNQKLLAQQQRYENRADNLLDNSSTLLRAAYQTGNEAKLAEAQAANVSAAGIRGFAGQPPAQMTNFLGRIDAERRGQEALKAEFENDPAQRRFNNTVQFIRANQGLSDQPTDFQKEYRNRMEGFSGGYGRNLIDADILTQFDAYGATDPTLRAGIATNTTKKGIADGFSAGLTLGQMDQQGYFVPMMQAIFPQGITNDKDIESGTNMVVQSMPPAVWQKLESTISRQAAELVVRELAKSIVLKYRQQMSSIARQK